eukprot:2349892-Pyramimonas_sp.AAC.1
MRTRVSLLHCRHAGFLATISYKSRTRNHKAYGDEEVPFDANIDMLIIHSSRRTSPRTQTPLVANVTMLAHFAGWRTSTLLCRPVLYPSSASTRTITSD